jgi:hypothetical protein
MRSAMFYLLHSTAIVALMFGSYFYGFKQAVKKTTENIFSFNKKR